MIDRYDLIEHIFLWLKLENKSTLDGVSYILKNCFFKNYVLFRLSRPS